MKSVGTALLFALSCVASTLAQGGNPGTIRFIAADNLRVEGIGLSSVTLERVGGTDGEVSVLITQTPGTATPGGIDYYAFPAPVSWGDQQAGYREFVVEIVNDTIDEPDETIHLSMSDFTGGATAGTPSQATLTIRDDDFAPGEGPGRLGFTAASYDTSEAMPFAVVGIERTDGSLGAVSTEYRANRGSALAGDDFEAVQGMLEWADGETDTKLVQIPLLDDNEVEGDEIFRVFLHDFVGGAEEGLTTATVTLRDNEAVPPCEDGDTQICLLDRFLVFAHWATANGQSGDGRVERLTDASAAFEFFEEGNTEIVVKLKDACALAPGDVLRNFWVFVAGLTNVRAEITLIDTESGVVRRFYNELNRPFFTVAEDSPDGRLNPPGAIQATSEALGAFPTCDL